MLAALLLAASLLPNAPSLRIFGPGPFTNFGQSHEANTNAVAHMWFGTACPLAISRWAGIKTWQAGAICTSAVLTRQTFFHGPTPGPEVRADLISGLGSIGIVLLIDAIVNR